MRSYPFTNPDSGVRIVLATFDDGDTVGYTVLAGDAGVKLVYTGPKEEAGRVYDRERAMYVQRAKDEGG